MKEKDGFVVKVPVGRRSGFYLSEALLVLVIILLQISIIQGV